MNSVGTSTMKAIKHPNNYLSVSSLSRAASMRGAEPGVEITLVQAVPSQMWCHPFRQQAPLTALDMVRR